MHPNAIHEGQLVEVEIGGDIFEATVKKKNPKAVSIEPRNPILHLYRYCHYTDIAQVVERPADESGAAA